MDDAKMYSDEDAKKDLRSKIIARIASGILTAIPEQLDEDLAARVLKFIEHDIMED